MADNISNNTKYGPWILKKDGKSAYREKIVNGNKKVEELPITKDNEEIMMDIKRQDNVNQLVGLLLYQRVDSIESGDDLMKLIGCINDDLTHLYINNETKKNFIEKINLFNDYFNTENKNDKEIINKYGQFLEVYFKLNESENKYGNQEFESLWDTLDEQQRTITNLINRRIEMIYDKNNEKKAPTH